MYQSDDLIEKSLTAISEMGTGGNTGMLQNLVRYTRDKGLATGLQTDVWTSTLLYRSKEHVFWTKILPLLTTPGHQDSFGTYRIQSEKTIVPRKAGNSIASVCIVALDDFFFQDEDMIFELDRRSAEYVFMLVLNFTKEERNARKVRFNFFGKFEVLNLNADEDQLSIEEILKKFIDNRTKAELELRQQLNTLYPVLHLIRESVNKENKLVGLRRNIYQQQQTIQRKDETQSNVGDINNSVKSLVQNTISEAERSHKSKYEELNKPQTGRFSAMVSKEANAFSEFERVDIAEKSEKWGIFIPEVFQADMLKKIVGAIQYDFAIDRNLLMSQLENAAGKANSILQERGILPQGAHGVAVEVSTFPEYDKIIANYSYYYRQYNGELVKKGAAEYFIALREYTGLIMVVAGLLAPLNMIASISENPVLKKMSMGIRIATGAITLGMIIWGYFDLRKRIPRKRKEESIRETNKAREHLQNEGKRICSECSKEWINQVSMWLRDNYNSLGQQLEKIMRDYQFRTQERNNDNRQKIQMMQSGLDNISKRLDNAIRQSDSNLKYCKDAMLETEKKVKDAVTV